MNDKKIVYTFAVEFDEAPTITKDVNILGGKLMAVQFSNAFVDLEESQNKLCEIQEWYDTDGSVGGLSLIMDGDK